MASFRLRRLEHLKVLDLERAHPGSQYPNGPANRFAGTGFGQCTAPQFPAPSQPEEGMLR